MTDENWTEKKEVCPMKNYLPILLCCYSKTDLTDGSVCRYRINQNCHQKEACLVIRVANREMEKRCVYDIEKDE